MPEKRQLQAPNRPPKSRTPAPTTAGIGRAFVDSLQLLQRTHDDPTSLNVSDAAHLQRLLGNRATGQLLQAKLTLGPAGDKYEQEADRVASQVMRSTSAPPSDIGNTDGQLARPAPVQTPKLDEDALQTRPLADGVSRIQRTEVDDSEALQARPLHGPEGGEVATSVAAAIGSARGGGVPLHEGVRASMERGFGADFRRVRIHTGSQADALNRALHSRAFTTGRDVFFRSGEYNPQSNDGQELIAHELTHTLQQGAVGVQRRADVVQRGVKDWFRKKFARNNTQQDSKKSLSLDEVIAETPTRDGKTEARQVSSQSLTLDPLDEEATSETTGVELLDGPHREALLSFQSHYTSATGALHMLKIDPSARIAEFGKLTAGVHVEDYSPQIFGNDKVKKLLKQIDEALSSNEAEEDASRVGRLVADMLLFASLVPSQTQREKHGAFGRPKMTRLTANVLSPARLIQNLIQIAQQAARGDSVTEAPSLRKIDFDDGDSVAQSMLKLSLSNMQETARKHLQETPLFQAMLKSPDILQVMLASGGAIDQRFQNTCAAAAINQEVQANASSIAGLLMVGRGVASYIEGKLNDKELEETLKEQYKRRGLKKTTLGQHAAKRVKQARDGFESIETRATRIMEQTPVNIGALNKLTDEWSRIMQKLAVVVNLEEGAEEAPVLSKTRVRGHWHTSAVVAFLLGAPFDRRKRRFKGIQQETYREALGETLDISTNATGLSSENLNDYLGDDKNERAAKLLGVWDKVFEAGGTEISIPGHELYMQAAIKNRQKLFIIGDPLIEKHEAFTIAEMERYAKKARKGQLGIRPDVLKGATPPAYLLNDDVSLYTNPTKLGDDAHKDTFKLTRDARISEAKRDVRQGKEWINVLVKPVDQPERRGWIDSANLVML